MDRNSSLQQVDRAGRERLYPSITNPSWLVLQKRREIFLQWVDRLPATGLNVLDIGGRLQPYRQLLGTRVKRYVGVDLQVTPLVDVLASGEALPLRDDSFDLTICTQVLQYVVDPPQLLSEVHRVLRPNGYLLLSVPSAALRDSDQECWRFLPYGLRQMLSQFRVVEIVPEGSSVAGFFRTVNVCLSVFVRYPSLRAVYHHTISPILNWTGFALDRVARKNDQFAVNYSVLAQK
jgi:SAM-dependent methyltransferase